MLLIFSFLDTYVAKAAILKFTGSFSTNIYGTVNIRILTVPVIPTNPFLYGYPSQYPLF